MITSTEGIILRTISFRSSSIIATVLTQEHGKIGILAKGAKNQKSKLGGKLRVGNIVEVVYYYKESRSIQILKEIDYAVKTFNNHSNMAKMAVATMTLELISQLVQDGEQNNQIYQFSTRFLTWLNDMQGDPTGIFAYNQIQLADIMGIGLALKIPEGRISDIKVSYLHIKEGLISPDSTNDLCYKLTPNQTLYMQLALTSKSSKILDINFEDNEYSNLIHNLDLYFKYHFDSIRERKSDQIFEKILAL